MPKRRSRKKRSSIIEIQSSDSESQSNNDANKKPSTATTEPILPPSDGNEHDDDDISSTKSSSTSEYRVLTRRKYVEQLPVASRTKNASNKGGVASMRLLSLDLIDGKSPGLSVRSQENMEKLSRLDSKKKNSLKDDIEKAVTEEMDDPELTRLLRKIAYCRVFTNYLFRQYDMLSIDFQLYSNLDDLMMDLKKRVGAYNAIKRSRRQILLGEPGRGESGSSSSREGSTV